MTDLNLDDLAAWTAAAPDSGVLLPSEIALALMACAAGEACRIARDDGREPNPEKWRSATDAVFAAAVARTALAQEKKP